MRHSALTPTARKQLCFAACDSGSIAVWDVREQKLIRYGAATARVLATVFLLLTATRLAVDSSFLGFPRCSVLQGHKGPVTCLAVAHDGLTLLSGSADKSLRIWNLKMVCVVGRAFGAAASRLSIDLSRSTVANPPSHILRDSVPARCWSLTPRLHALQRHRWRCWQPLA